MSDDHGDEDTQWTAEAGARMSSAGGELLAALSAHIELLSKATLTTPWTEIFDGNIAVEQAAIAYANAQFDLTGNSGPFGEVKEWEDEDEDEDEDDDDEQPLSFVSVLQRADYGVLDEQAVLEAGRLKFLENRPGQSESNAQSGVAQIGAALYELAHADGWDSLSKVAGLTPMGSVIQVVVPVEAIELQNGLSESDEPDGAFSVGGVVLHSEANYYRT